MLKGDEGVLDLADNKKTPEQLELIPAGGGPRISSAHPLPLDIAPYRPEISPCVWHETRTQSISTFCERHVIRDFISFAPNF